ncbi:helix-turn-helix domain-containing protein [Kitasatospora sp. NPDC048194]|uniref:helix-turn-helix domain-containing protein n=1 Tax=Kitasatospora sp. NPDC048194 TaxID=3364045 RepID=UPI00371624FA
MDYGQQLSAALRDRRRQLGISQTELARRAGMTQPGVSRVELGDTTPTLPLLARLAEALEADLDIRLSPLDGRTTMRFVPHRHADAA